MDKFADLHIHTYFSDSTDSPEEVIEQARQKKLAAIAITDHDTVEGIDPTIEAAAGSGIEVIPGIELSSNQNGRDIHVLGYFFDYKNKKFLKKLKEVQADRLSRMKEMIQKLGALGIKGITLDEVLALGQSESIGRPHLATVLVQKGHVANMKQAFNKYLAEGMPAYVDKFKLSPAEAISLIKEAGGISVLAHPMVTNVDEMIPQFAKDGLDGLEVYYPNCANNITSFYEGIAKKRKLLIAGGSDAHGKTKKNTFVGRVKLPYVFVEQMKEALAT